MTLSKSQQIIQKAINEKHEKAANSNVFSEGRNQWNLDDIRRAESAFRVISQEPQQALSHAAHDADFYQTEIAQRLRTIAKQHGTDIGFFKGTDDARGGADIEDYHATAGRVKKVWIHPEFGELVKEQAKGIR